MRDERFVAYRRSSTPEQTIGLEMQQTAINQYVERVGGQLIDWYKDVGSASPTQSRLQKQQPELVRAIARARAEKASLIVARLDRLTRSTAVLAALLESGPHLLVVETPNASPFVLQIYIELVDSLPMTPTNKLMRRDLPNAVGERTITVP